MIQEDPVKSEVTIPKFGELLGPLLSQVPPAAYPGFLARLERSAADRYRAWAEAIPEHAQGLLACASREDEIADRIETILPVPAEHEALVCDLLPKTINVYYEAFAGYSLWEQLAIQADAEKQGSAAWPNLIPAFPAHEVELNALSELELESGAYLDQLLADQAA
jgi:hypothetical protein